MKCHTQKNDKSTPASQSHSRRNTTSEGVPPQPGHDEFNLNSPSAVANGSQTGIPLMQILSPSNYLPQSGNAPKLTRHPSMDNSNLFLAPSSSSGDALNMQLPGTSWTIHSPINTLNNKTSHDQKPSPSQNSGRVSAFETSVTSPPNPGQTPRSEMAPVVQFSDSNIEWLPQNR